MYISLLHDSPTQPQYCIPCPTLNSKTLMVKQLDFIRDVPTKSVLHYNSKVRRYGKACDTTITRGHKYTIDSQAGAPNNGIERNTYNYISYNISYIICSYSISMNIFLLKNRNKNNLRNMYGSRVKIIPAIENDGVLCGNFPKSTDYENSCACRPRQRRGSLYMREQLSPKPS